jgi:predicted phage tail protein
MSQQLDRHPLRSEESQGPAAAGGRDVGLMVSLAAIVVGAALLFAGYWGASETVDPGEQIPHLASATIPGLALVIGGAVLLVRREQARQRSHTQALVERMDALLAWLGSTADPLDQADQPNGVEPAEPASNVSSDQ